MAASSRFLGTHCQDRDVSESTQSEHEASNFEDELGFLSGEKVQRNTRRRLPVERVARISIVTNIILTVFLVGTWIVMIPRYNNRASNLLDAPYSPLIESGVVKYINKKFKPEHLFQQPPSDEVDAAWNLTQGPSDGLVRLPREMAAKLPETTEIYYEPGYYVYGVNVFHQLHCLNILRQSYYPDRYFPNASEHMVNHHIYHCLDFLRQSIICAGDVTMDYWWNHNWTRVDEFGNRQYTDRYTSKTPQERVKDSFVTWDTVHQCRDISAITDWVSEHQVMNDAFKKHVMDEKLSAGQTDKTEHNHA